MFPKRLPDVATDVSEETDTMHNLRAMISPLFIAMCLIMTITAATELGTNQWVGSLLEASGASPLVVLALVSVLMALGRYFAGPLVKAFNPAGVLLFSAIVSAIGIYLLSTATGGSQQWSASSRNTKQILAHLACLFWRDGDDWLYNMDACHWELD